MRSVLQTTSHFGRSPAPIAVLCVQPDSVYKALPGVQCFDADRDARTFTGGMPVVAHPPCRFWSRFRTFAKASEEVRQAEMELGRFCVRAVQTNGGVLEHPAGSQLWQDMGLPVPHRLVAPGTDASLVSQGVSLGAPGTQAAGLVSLAEPSLPAYTLEVSQWAWGHKAFKPTWLYVVGVPRDWLPTMPHLERLEETKLVLRLSTKQRSATPPAFAQWLVALARRAKVA